MDFLGFQINTNVDIWIIITLFGVICYFFGRLISEVKPHLFDDKGVYIEGFFFVIGYMGFPIAVIYTTQVDALIGAAITRYGGASVIISSITITIVQVVVMFILRKKYDGLNFVKINLKETFDRALTKEMKSNKIIKRIKTDDSFLNLGKNIATQFYFAPLSNVWGLISASVIIFSLMMILNLDTSTFMKFFSIIISVVNLSFISILVNYPKEYGVVDVCYGSEMITGRLIKIGKDFVTLNDDNRVYHISREKINYIGGKAYSKEEVQRKFGMTPKFHINMGADLTKQDITFDFKIENTGDYPAHDVLCLISAIDKETGLDVINNHELFRITLLPPHGAKTAKASGTFGDFQKNKEYEITYTISCKELQKPDIANSKLRTFV